MPLLNRLLVVFLLFFPKGGFKVGEIPITFGYILLAIAMGLALLKNLASGTLLRVSGRRAFMIAALIFLLGVFLLHLYANGNTSTGYTVALIVSLGMVPLAFVWLLAPQIDEMALPPLFSVIRAGIFFIAVYGIFLFFYKMQTGNFIEVPFLTVSSDDAGNLEEKNINRGGIFKLISTYNNGNIYGVALLMLLPLYDLLEPNSAKKYVVKGSLILTLSRTVWIGLMLYELLVRVYISRVSVKAIILVVTSLLFLAVGVYLSLGLIGVDSAFLVDRNLGGRLNQFSIPLGFLSDQKFASISEIVYVSVLRQFGILGLIAFIVAMVAPLVMHFLKKVPDYQSVYKRSLAVGIAIYLIIAWSDGAILLIPVMAFYWFLVGLLLSPNYFDAQLKKKRSSEVVPDAPVLPQS